ncbi:MAG: serine/threonine-protein kinase, partial [Planctomycetota bacterium]
PDAGCPEGQHLGCGVGDTVQQGPQSLSAGTEIDDFLIIRALGRGAFAHVYLAQQVSMQRLVALKISRGGLDESQTLARLDHQGIVRVFDQRRVQLPAGDGDGHLLYMQYVPGGTLSDIVSAAASCEPRHRNGHLVLDCVDQNLLRSAQQVPERSRVRLWLSSASWPTVVAWMGIQLARALHVAHQTGILHRDVKPANVLISAEGMPRLADFNVSFAGAAGRSGAAASFGGSIGYMSPEHLAAVSLISGVPPESKVANSLNADCVGQPADLYSLAVLLWELWQGRRPFDCNATPNSWTDAIVDQSQSRARSYLPNPIETTVDAGDAASERVLEQTLRQTLSLHVQQRPADGRALAGRLRLVLFPAAAKIFDIPDRGIRRWIANLTPWIVTTTLILTPNIAAGVFNWFYNFTQIIGNHPEMADGFQTLSNCVNAIFFPLGGFLIVWLSRDF